MIMMVIRLLDKTLTSQSLKKNILNLLIYCCNVAHLVKYLIIIIIIINVIIKPLFNLYILRCLNYYFLGIDFSVLHASFDGNV